MAQRVAKSIALLFHDRGTSKGWVVSSTPRPHFTSGKHPVPILQEPECAPGPVWTGRKSRPHRDSIPDRPVRSQSLYRRIYPAHLNTCTEHKRTRFCSTMISVLAATLYLCLDLKLHKFCEKMGCRFRIFIVASKPLDSSHSPMLAPAREDVKTVAQIWYECGSADIEFRAYLWTVNETWKSVSRISRHSIAYRRSI